MASHAGTTPMDRRRDAAAAVAELALYLEKRAARRPTWSARWACSRCRTARPTSCPAAASSRSTSAPPPTRCATPAPPTCWPSCRRSASAAASCSRIEETMRAAAAPVRARVAAALGARRRGGRPAGAPHAQRRRPRRDEAARGDAAGDAVRARRERRHQPQPARIEHHRRHAARGRGLQHLATRRRCAAKHDPR